MGQCITGAYPYNLTRVNHTDVLPHLNHDLRPTNPLTALLSSARNTLLYAVSLTAQFDLYYLFLSIFYASSNVPLTSQKKRKHCLCLRFFSLVNGTFEDA